jgi:DeoR/GlpR family transcriptional regulator of sugar metabolism
MGKYKIICKSCNTVHGFADKPIIDGLSAKCSACGLERIAIEQVAEEIYSQLNFDIFITNKKSAYSVHNGFLLNVEELKGKSAEQVKELFIEKAARALAELIDKGENIVSLIEGGKTNEIN